MSKRLALVPYNPDQPEVWERLEDEKTHHFHWFALYCEMGARRSHRRLAATLPHVAAGTIAATAKWNQWKKRVEEYDLNVVRERRLRQREEMEKHDERTARVADAMIAVVVRRLQSLSDEEIPAHVLPKMFDTADKMKRRSAGEPDRRIAIDHEVIHNGGEQYIDAIRDLVARTIERAGEGSLVIDVEPGGSEGLPRELGAGTREAGTEGAEG